MMMLPNIAAGAVVYGVHHSTQRRAKEEEELQGLTRKQEAVLNRFKKLINNGSKDSLIGENQDQFISKGVSLGEGDDFLREAIQNNRPDLVQKLIDRGVDVKYSFGHDETYLHWAAVHGTPATINSLLKAGIPVNIKKTSYAKDTPLHDTAKFDAKDEDDKRRITANAKALIAAGADIQAQDKLGNTPLHDAICSKNTELVQVLIDAAILHPAKLAILNAKNAKGETPFLKAATFGFPHNCEVLNKLAQAGANIHASDMEDNNFLHKLFHNYVNPKTTTNHIIWLLEYAENNADTKLATIVNAINKKGRTPIHEAAEKKSFNAKDVYACIKMLLDAGAKTNIQDKYGTTALHEFVMNHDSQYFMNHPLDRIDVKSILEQFVQATRRDNAILLQSRNKSTPFHVAANKNQTYLMDLLLKEGVEIEGKSEFGRTPLLSAAQFCKPETVQFLLANGADILAKDDRNNTILHLAAAGGNDEVIQYLKDLKDSQDPQNIHARQLDFLALNMNGETPRHRAKDYEKAPRNYTNPGKMQKLYALLPHRPFSTTLKQKLPTTSAIPRR